MTTRVLVIDDSPTVRKIVGSILSKYDYEPLVAADGQAGLELARQEKVDLVLLDFVMPGMNGYEFCRRLRSHPKLYKVPVVLMSAKAESIRDKFLQRTGAMDAITKPFDARALVAVVEGVLQRAAAGRGPKPPQPNAMADESTLVRNLDSSQSSRVPDDGPTNDRARRDVATLLGTILSAVMKDVTADGGAKQPSIDHAILKVLDDGTLQDLTRKLRGLKEGNDERAVLTGDLAAIQLGEILQVLQMQRQTGVLDVTNGQVEVFISLRDGFIDLAQSTNASVEFRLGRYLVEAGSLADEQLADAVTQSTASKRLLGDTLVHMGLVSEEGLRQALIRQTSEMIYEVLRWQHGRFALHRDVVVAEAEAAHLGLSVASIIMEGFRRVDEWRLIEESIRFDEALVRNEAAIGTLRQGELTRQELAVLDAVDGHRSVREIIDLTHQSSFDTCKTFYRLLQSRLVRRPAGA